MESSNLNIKIKTMDNSLYELEIKRDITVIGLKKMIEEKMKVPISKQRLIFHGKLLIDNDNLLKYQVDDGHVIHMVANSLENHQNETQITQPQNNQNTQDRINNLTSVTNEIDYLTGIIRTLNQTTLNRRNLRRRMIQQRSNGFNFEFNESLETIRQNYQSITTILDNSTKLSELTNLKNITKNTFVNPFNFTNRKLNIGQWVDVKDTIDQWLEAQVTKVMDNQVYIHYNGWGNRWDEWIDMNSPRIAIFRTYTVQSSHSHFLSPNPISQADAENSEIINNKLDVSDFLFDVGSLLNRMTADIIELGKLINAKKFKNKELQEDVEEFKINENNIPNEFKSNLLSSQLAPIFDRVGRMMIDLSPHLAMMGSPIQTVYTGSTPNEVNINENQENLQKNYVYQIPIMLTPGEILASNTAVERNNNDSNENFPRSAIIINTRSSYNEQPNSSNTTRSEPTNNNVQQSNETQNINQNELNSNNIVNQNKNEEKENTENLNQNSNNENTENNNKENEEFQDCIENNELKENENIQNQ